MEWLLKSLFLDIKSHQNEERMRVIPESSLYARPPLLGLWDPQWLLSWCDVLSLGAQSSHYPSLPVFTSSGRCCVEPEPRIQLPIGWGHLSHFHFFSKPITKSTGCMSNLLCSSLFRPSFVILCSFLVGTTIFFNYFKNKRSMIHTRSPSAAIFLSHLLHLIDHGCLGRHRLTAGNSSIKMWS